MSDEQKTESIEVLLVVKLPLRCSVLIGLVDLLTERFGKKVFMRQQDQWLEFFRDVDNKAVEKQIKNGDKET